MPATWLTILGWISIAAGFVSAAAVLYDIYGNGLRQPMRVLEAVWPITALYLGPLGLLLYSGLGRPRRSRGALDAAKPSPQWQGIFISATHCGAGCALGDIVDDWLVCLTGVTIGGMVLWPEYVVDFVFAYVLGILFQVLRDQADDRSFIARSVPGDPRDALPDRIRSRHVWLDGPHFG